MLAVDFFQVDLRGGDLQRLYCLFRHRKWVPRLRATPRRFTANPGSPPHPRPVATQQIRKTADGTLGDRAADSFPVSRFRDGPAVHQACRRSAGAGAGIKGGA